MKYYEVAPLTYIGKDTNVLTYSSIDEIDVGTLVSISLRGKTVNGILLGETSKPAFATKNVYKTEVLDPVISKDMIRLAKWISEYYICSLPSVLSTILPSGLTKRRRRIVLDSLPATKDNHKELTKDQLKILQNLVIGLPKKPQLLFGVTGSGKTEIYLQLIEKQLENKKSVIVLVPEVSLTPQAYERYSARFGKRVVVMHSYLKETERYSAWKQVYNGEKDIIIGSRSALFAPVSKLGLIIIDEAHDSSYKQDGNPRYEATKVAEKLSSITGCGLVFGTATPNIDMYYRAQKGLYDLHTMNKRIVQDTMPDIEVVDMRHEFKFGNKSIFSEALQKGISTTLKDKGQVLLFINRRGMSTFVSCRDCGYVEKCPNCDIPLTFHYEDMKLVCHHCNHTTAPPVTCPKCSSMAIKYFGSGTQKVELEIKKLFGDVRISRMDHDTTRKSGAHANIYKSFEAGEVDILIGTQMITKGWDLPNVRLVGVVSADAMLNYPDFRANERAYQLITQIAGRTGRGKHGGKVILQTYTPDNPIFKSIQKHDYPLFYKGEISVREELVYPPFVKLVKMLYNNETLAKAEAESERVANLLVAHQMIGPCPAFIPKLNGKYRQQIVIKVEENNLTQLVKQITEITNDNWSIDVDPVSLI